MLVSARPIVVGLLLSSVFWPDADGELAAL